MMVDRRVSAATIARFAQLVFAYIDELSGASVAGHRDELATSGRVREQLLERLADRPARGRAGRSVAGTRRARRLARPGHDHRGRAALGARRPGARACSTPARSVSPATWHPGSHRTTSVCCSCPTPTAAGPPCSTALHGRGAIVGPTRTWTEADVSYAPGAPCHRPAAPARRRAARHRGPPRRPLVLTADLDALGDLRARALRPLADVRPAVADRLTETLRSWLLHQGRRDDVAADLNIHAQTVRYRMTQVRELFGDTLADPAAVLELVVALALPQQP